MISFIKTSRTGEIINWCLVVIFDRRTKEQQLPPLKKKNRIYRKKYHFCDH